MVLRHGALFRAFHDSARRNAFRQFVYRFLRVGWNAGVLTVGAFTVLGMTSAIVGGTPFDGVSRDAYRLGAFISLQEQGNGEIYLGEGWGAADDRGRWLGEPASLVEIPSTGFPPRDVFLLVETHTGPQLNGRDAYLDVLANGVPLGRLKLPTTNKDAQGFWLRVPASAVARHDKTLILCLLAFSDSHGMNGDPASVAVRIDQIYLADSV
jgi:hypothetical protein